MQIFKANFQCDGWKMQKNFISKSFSKRLKKMAGSLGEGWRKKSYLDSYKAAFPANISKKWAMQMFQF